MRHKLEDEFRRMSKFQKVISGTEFKEDPAEIEVNIRTYAKYLLREGSVSEKRELLGNLRSRLVYKNKTVTLLAD